MKLLLAGMFALAGGWGFLLAALSWANPSQVGPGQGPWGAIAGIVCLPIALLLGGLAERDLSRTEDPDA